MPRDAELGVARESMSPGLAAMNDMAAMAGPFAGAAGLLENLAGVRLAVKRVERAAEASGTAVAKTTRAQATLIAARKLVPLPPSPVPDKLYAVIDGTGVPMTSRETAGRDGKGPDGRARTREVKLAVFFTQDKLDEDGYPVRDRDSTSIIATFEPASAFADLVKAEGIRRGANHVRQLTIIGDGAAWIWGIASTKFPEATQIVDLYHAREHLHDLARRLEFMLGDSKDAWLAARLEDLDYGYVDGITAATRKYPLAGVKKDEIDTALGYFEANAPACATTGSANAACSSAPASWRPAARPSSASGSSSRACTGPSTAPTPSSPSAAARPAALGSRPSATATAPRSAPPSRSPAPPQPRRTRALPYPGEVLSLRPMTGADLPAVDAWLRLPHVARWWTPDTTAEAEIAKYRERVRPGSKPATHMLMVTLDSRPAGWCQWYRWADYPANAHAIGARDGEIGIDYAIGDPAQIGRGTGTTVIATLVTEIRRRHPGAGILTDPDAANTASRRVLEKNGFHLVAIRPVATEPSDTPMAIYRLSSPAPTP